MMILLNHEFSVTSLSTKAARSQLVRMMIVIQVSRKSLNLGKVLLISESSFTLSIFLFCKRTW